jgi:hypothetical protein
MNRVITYAISLFGIAVVALSGYAAYAYYVRPKNEQKSIPNEPFAAKALDIQKDYGTTSEGSTTLGSPETTGVSVGTSGTGLVQDTNPQVLEIPLDRSSEFAGKLNPDVKTVKLTSPLVYVDEYGRPYAAYQSLTVNRATPDGVKTTTEYVDEKGNTYKSEQDLFNAFIQQSSAQGLKDLESGKNLSVIDSINQGIPINVTNVLTKLPESFPKAKPDAISVEFQRRAQAIGKTLTAENPGGSSAAGVANFSRLAALGADLSQVDLYNVRNPDFVGKVSATGLTPKQQEIIDRLRAGKGYTSQELAEVKANEARRAQEIAQTTARAKELTNAGYTEEKGVAYLASQGIKVNGSLTAQQFAGLEAKLGTGATQACLNCSPNQTTKLNISSADQQKVVQNFLKQTGRKDLSNLTVQELYVLKRALGVTA